MSSSESQPLDPAPRPVFLYFDPHPVHERIATHLGAEFVQCRTGGPLGRVLAGARHDFADRPVLLEGGVPLLEGAVTKLLGESGPVLALGADSTYRDLFEPMAGRSRASRAAHWAAQPLVDATLAVSDRVAAVAERVTRGPVRVAHPFVTAERFERLRAVDPDLAGDRVLCVGKYRPKNGQDVLVDALDRADADLTVDFVGPDTEDIPAAPGVRRHGFVSEDDLVGLFDGAAMLAFPASVGAFPVVTLEGLAAGLPVLTSPRVGTATLVRGVHDRLAVDADPARVASALEWYDGLSADRRRALGARAAGYGAGFGEADRLPGFGRAFAALLEDLGYDYDYDYDYDWEARGSGGAA
jgi:glycosyltransferase involved in cell wall biosynthesis